MSPLRTAWALLFRLFPCPTETGLQRIGRPGRDSPVLVTCNFHLTVKRLRASMGGTDAWLVVADSHGVNVWCAAGGDVFNTDAVVAALKTSGVADQVDHRRVILPPLAATAVRAKEVESRTDWRVRWGPVRAQELPRYLADGCRRSEPMKRASYTWYERLDTGLGSLFVFVLIGGLGFAAFGRSLLWHYGLAAVSAFLVFMLGCPWIPGKRGLTKALVLDAFIVLAAGGTELVFPGATASVRSGLVLFVIMVLLYGGELGGLSSTMSSELDPVLARLGVGAIGNTAFAGTVRTELLNHQRRLTYDPTLCERCRACEEICPVAVWTFEAHSGARLAHLERCVACRACLEQCPSGAISAPRVV